MQACDVNYFWHTCEKLLLPLDDHWDMTVYCQSHQPKGEASGSWLFHASILPLPHIPHVQAKVFWVVLAPPHTPRSNRKLFHLSNGSFQNTATSCIVNLPSQLVTTVDENKFCIFIYLQLLDQSKDTTYYTSRGSFHEL